YQRLPSRWAPTSGAWPCAQLVRAISRPARARYRVSTSAIVGRSTGETAIPTRKKRRRVLPSPKGRGLRAAILMPGRMINFDAAGAAAPGYLATPDGGTGPGVVVLHAWWGLTEPFRQVCDRLAEAGFVALAPDLYRGKSATTVEDAEALATSLNG